MRSDTPLHAAPPSLTVADLHQRVARLEALLLDTNRGIPVTVAAARLGVHRNTILGWIHRGTAPATKWMGEWEIDPTWVAAETMRRGRFEVQA